jgi:hypothetical protein
VHTNSGQRVSGSSLIDAYLTAFICVP